MTSRKHSRTSRVAAIGSGQSAKVELHYNRSTKLFYVVKVMFRDLNEPFAQYKLKCLKEYQVSEIVNALGNSDSYLATIDSFAVELVLHGIAGSRKIVLFMDYYPLTLSQFLTAQPCVSSRLVLFKQIALGVRHLHSCGIAHRDLKIDNVCLNLTGQVKIIDYGACLLNNSTGKEEQSTGIYGTDPFISPDAISSIHYSGLKNDMWSLGIIMYILLNNEDPRQTTGKSTTAVLKGINVENPVLRYPWDTISSNDAKYQAFRVLQTEIEHQEINHMSDRSLYLEYQKTLACTNLPKHKTINNVPELTSINLKSRQMLQNKELGIYRLWRNLLPDLPPSTWNTLAALLKINPNLRCNVEQLFKISPWLNNVAASMTDSSKDYTKFEQMRNQKTTRYSKMINSKR